MEKKKERTDVFELGVGGLALVGTSAIDAIGADVAAMAGAAIVAAGAPIAFATAVSYITNRILEAIEGQTAYHIARKTIEEMYEKLDIKYVISTMFREKDADVLLSLLDTDPGMQAAAKWIEGLKEWN